MNWCNVRTGHCVLDACSIPNSGTRGTAGSLFCGHGMHLANAAVDFPPIHRDVCGPPMADKGAGIAAIHGLGDRRVIRERCRHDRLARKVRNVATVANSAMPELACRAQRPGYRPGPSSTKEAPTPWSMPPLTACPQKHQGSVGNRGAGVGSTRASGIRRQKVPSISGNTLGNSTKVQVHQFIPGQRRELSARLPAGFSIEGEF